MRLKPVREQVVVVMGASSGIGRATARLFAKKGAKVVVAARSKEGLETLVEEIRREHGTATAVVADVANADEVRRVADAAVKEHGRIDTWAHVAGVGLWATVEQSRPEEFRRVVDVNLLGQLHGALAALPHLRKNGGALVHVTSVEAKISLPFNSAYAASKHGASALLDVLRMELRREGAPVSVTEILPAGIDTPLFMSALTRIGVEPRPTPPVYDPELVAKAIVYAAEHRVRDLVVGGAGVFALLAQRLAPRLVDQILLGVSGFESQMTDKPKSPDAPNDLFRPTAHGDLRVRGDLGSETRTHSLATRIQETAVARVAHRVMAAGRRVTARVFNTIFALRFRGPLRGISASRGGEGKGLPAPVRAERIGVSATGERRRRR